jgi:hypothetical protein
MTTFKILRSKLRLRALWLLPLIAGGLVLAATLFDPEAKVDPVGYVGAPAASLYNLSNTNVLPWTNTGATYTLNSLVKSPVNSKVYRRIVASSAGTTDPSLDTTNWALDTAQIFFTTFNSNDWTGNLLANTLNDTGAVSADNNWGTDGPAASIETLGAANRKIVTRDAAGSPIPFQWASLTQSQKDDLGAQTVLNFIRGSRADESPNGAGYRARTAGTGLLGDIIHSTPLHWSDGTNKTVFVGANDGMLHAFNAQTGVERFAYIPSLFINDAANASKLRDLTKNPYEHKYFVDGQLAARKFAANAALSRTEKSILVGGLGGGGKGLFALDVGAIPTGASTSAIETNAASKILWEVTNQGDFANLGHTYGKPALVTLPDGRAAVLVANGYNNGGNYGSSLFVINAYTGELIKEIKAGTGTAADRNGLSSPTAVDTNSDYKEDTAYAGDINGTMWAFNLSAASLAQANPQATALHTTDPAQAITMAPSIKAHPSGGRLVVFATGKLFTTADSTGTAGTAPHYAYGIWDRPSAFDANAALLEQTLFEVSYTGASPSIRVRTATAYVPNWTAGAANHKGWKTKLETTSPAIVGERVVGDGAFVTGDVFVFMTANPSVAATSTTLAVANWWMQLNALTGGANNATRFDLNADGQINADDQVSGANPVGRFWSNGVYSQFTRIAGNGTELLYSNYVRNSGTPDTTITTTTTDIEIGGGLGVAGGHFDVDAYYGSSLTGNNGKFKSQIHKHNYDDEFNVTGLNMRNASVADFNLINAISSTATQFKVIASNQYLSPAANLHLDGSPAYDKTSTAGYIPLKTYSTQADVTALQESLRTYTRANVNSLVVNLPVNAFTAKDWWGGALGLKADVRVGLHPTQTGCVKEGDSDDGGNMYQPVNPPARVLATATTALSATGNGSIPNPRSTGVRHNGALTIQVIKADTTDAQLELSVPGSPEYGWRVKSAHYATQVLAEYTVFWHHGNKKCYGVDGWTKTPAPDNAVCTPKDSTKCNPTPPGSDPTGKFGTGGSSERPPEGSTTTSVTNPDGSTTTTVVTIKHNDDGTYTTTTVKTTVKTVPGTTVLTTEPPCQGCGAPTLTTGRVNWRELRR